MILAAAALDAYLGLLGDTCTRQPGEQPVDDKWLEAVAELEAVAAMATCTGTAAAAARVQHVHHRVAGERAGRALRAGADAAGTIR